MIIMIEFMDIFMIIMDLMVIIVAATVITNSILMNVFERTKEFGTLRAIGLKKWQLFWMLMTEGASNGVIGSILGLAIGIPLVLYFQSNGLDFGAVSETFGQGKVFNFSHNPANSFISFFSGILIALTGSLYAALASIKMRLIETLNYV